MPTPRVTAARRKAILTRHREPGDPELVAAQVDHAALSVEEYVDQVVASLPPLTEAQKARFSALLAPSVLDRVDAA